MLATGVLGATPRKSCGSAGDLPREAPPLGRPPLATATHVISHLLVPEFVSPPRLPDRPASKRRLLADSVRSERMLIFSDLHTHPARAFLSPADIAAPFGARNGFYATVIPNFAQGAPGEGWRMYEALGGRWHEVALETRIHELGV